MRFLSVCLFVSVSLLRGASFDGTWGAEVIAPDGNITGTYFTLHQKGNEITGSVIRNFGARPIRQGKVDGNRIRFIVEVGDPARPVQIPWEGVLEGKEIHFKSTPPDRPAIEMVAKAADPSVTKPPAKLPLPTLKDLPYNKLAVTPPLGWNSWNKFRDQVDDKSIREIADAMTRNGMSDAGYLYVNIDDTWQGQRDSQGRIHPNKKFPDMKALANYVHSKDLLIGIYSSPGPKTCAGYEGSYGHEQQDAETYAEWGFDYLKYDWCSASSVYQDSEMRAVYQKMGEILQALPRPMIYSLCQYGRDDVWKWAPKVGGNLWRTTGDIRDSWESMTKIGFGQNDLAPYAGAGHWNDPDMLELGNGGMTDDEYRVHFSLWAMLAAPLIAGNDVRKMSDHVREMLVNKEVIGIDRDQLAKQGTRFSRNGDQEVWSKPLAGGAVAVALFNLGPEPAKMSLKWSDFIKSASPKARDLWKHNPVKVTSPDETWSTTVPKHGVVLLRLSAS